MGVEVEFNDSVIELPVGAALTFGRGSATKVVDLVIAADPHLHACTGSITATTDGWVLANLGTSLVLRLSELPHGGTVDVHPNRSVLCPWPSAAIGMTVRSETGAARYEITVESDPIFGVIEPSNSDSGTVMMVGIDPTRTYYRVLVELCRPKLEFGTDAVPEAKDIARRLKMTARAVEKHIEYLRTKYGLGPERLYQESNAGMEQRGTQQQLVDIAILSGDVGRSDLFVNPTDLEQSDPEKSDSK
jgi:hypothetical protein